MPLLFPGSLTHFLTLHRFSCLLRIKLFPSPVPFLEAFLVQQSVTPASALSCPLDITCTRELTDSLFFVLTLRFVILTKVVRVMGTITLSHLPCRDLLASVSRCASTLHGKTMILGSMRFYSEPSYQDLCKITSSRAGELSEWLWVFSSVLVVLSPCTVTSEKWVLSGYDSSHCNLDG